MPEGLSRRLKYAFLLQVALATLAILFGAYLATVAVTDKLSREALREEAGIFWRMRTQDASARPPVTGAMQGYFVADASVAGAGPAAYRKYGVGYHRVGPQRVLLVEQRGNSRLYIEYNQKRLVRFAFWFVLTPTGLALLAVFVTTWLTYRTATRMVSPVDWLAREVGRWDPREPDTNALASDKLPVDAGSETRQLAGALQRMAERTRAFVRRERDFTRDASHELRTPLTVIRVASDLLMEDPDLPPRASRSLQRIQRAGLDMEAVIDAFLILARESDIEPQREDFDVRDVVYEQVEKVRPLLSGKPVELHVAESASPRLHASPRVLAVMLDNLLRNACTFTEQGRVDVRIENDRIVIQDTGIGMSQEALRRAYDPFFRADLENPSGKGMGLSIVRRLGERFDWPVGIESEPGRGTTAVVRFGN